MDQAQLLGLIGSLYDKFVADVSVKVESRLLESIIDRLNTSGMLTTEVDTRIQVKIDNLGPIDKEMVRNVVQDELENADLDDKISDWMSNSFDIDDHVDIEDKVDNYLSDRLANMVKDEVSELSFSVSVDRC